MLDMVNDTSLYGSERPSWDLTVKAGSKLDLDRNGRKTRRARRCLGQ